GGVQAASQTAQQEGANTGDVLASGAMGAGMTAALGGLFNKLGGKTLLGGEKKVKLTATGQPKLSFGQQMRANVAGLDDRMFTSLQKENVDHQAVQYFELANQSIIDPANLQSPAVDVPSKAFLPASDNVKKYNTNL